MGDSPASHLQYFVEGRILELAHSSFEIKKEKKKAKQKLALNTHQGTSDYTDRSLWEMTLIIVRKLMLFFKVELEENSFSFLLAKLRLCLDLFKIMFLIF